MSRRRKARALRIRAVTWLVHGLSPLCPLSRAAGFAVEGLCPSGARVDICVRRRSTARAIREALYRGAASSEIGALILSEAA